MEMVSRRGVMAATAGALLARTDGAQAAGQAQSSPAPHQKNAPRFGLGLHVDRFPATSAFLQLAEARAAGAQSIRGLAVALSTIEPSPGRWTFAKPDRDLEFMEPFGLDILGGLGYGVAWSASRDLNHTRSPAAWSTYPPDDMSVWEEYVTKVVERYRGRIHAWSPWNEPDSFGFFMPVADRRDEESLLARRNAFLEMQKRTYVAGKRADPASIILSGAFAMGGNIDRDFVPWLIDHGMLDYCDALDVHMYWSIKNLEDTANRANDLIRKAGKVKPVWFTEFGASVKSAMVPPFIGAVEHSHVANMAPKALATALAMGIERLYWYEGYTPGPASLSVADSGYSLAVTDGPTPAFWSFSAAARLLREAQYAGPAVLDCSAGQGKGYLFQVADGQVAMLWAESPEGLDNRPASARGIFTWNNRGYPIELSERPTVLFARLPSSG
jgi:hypothetical protein